MASLAEALKEVKIKEENIYIKTEGVVGSMMLNFLQNCNKGR